MTRRPRSANVLLAIISTFVAVISAELVIASVAPQRTLRRVLRDEPAMYVNSDVLSQALRPGYRGTWKRDEFAIKVRINDDGFRGPPLLPRSCHRSRVVFIGDSFTFGHGVEDEEAYPALTGAKLSEGGTPVEAINAGFAAGYAPDAYYLFLRTRDAELKPDLVVIGFFLGNDIDGYSNDHWTEVDADSFPLRIRNEQAEVDSLGYMWPRKRSFAYSTPIWRNSNLMHLLGRAVRNVQDRISPPPERVTPFDSVYDTQITTAVATTKRLFGRMHAELAHDSIPLLVVMIPTIHQVRAFKSAGPGAEQGGKDWTRPNREFARLFDSLGVNYIDLLPDIATKPGEAGYFSVDEHWNVTGHRRAAKLIAPRIREMLGKRRVGTSCE